MKIILALFCFAITCMFIGAWIQRWIFRLEVEEHFVVQKGMEYDFDRGDSQTERDSALDFTSTTGTSAPSDNTPRHSESGKTDNEGSVRGISTWRE